MKIKRLLLVFNLVLVSLFFNAYPIFASNNFMTDYHVIYTVNEAGKTHADLSVALTNTSKQFYASSYQMQLGFNNITNIKASDSLGPIKTAINKTNNGYNITLTFNKKSVGLGTKLPFNLSFDTDSITRHSGKIWEINIPGIANTSDFDSFIVDVKAPNSFGKPAFAKPHLENNNLTFNKAQLGRSGISIAFGETQSYSFHLKYHLKNSNLFPVKSEIALPPNTNYQQINIQDISPRPDNVIIDPDGNWLAQYSLSPAQKKDIKVSGISQVRLNPNTSSISSAEQALYTNQTSNWQSQNPKIKKLANQLKTTKAIYQYVITTLKYDFARVADDKGRLGAVNALNNPNSAVCREFTDLFIALARSAGIPAREVDGYAYTENNKERPLSLVADVLHAWPEYYDMQRKTWIMVDPTWGATTGGVDYFNVLDFDHLAFAIKGKRDDYPVPAGGYKSDGDKNVKDVTVSFGDLQVDKKARLAINPSFLNPQIAGFPIKAMVKLENSGPAAAPAQTLYVSSKNLTPYEQSAEVAFIPPFGYRTVDLNFDKTSFLTNKETLITMRFGDITKSQILKIAPFFMTFWGIGGITVGLLTITLLIIAGKSRRL